MAVSRKGWQQLSPNYRQRLERSGISKTKYEPGASLKAARGHKATPEHAMKEALKKPATFRKYIARNPQQEAIEINTVRDRAYRNSRNRLGDYPSYRPNNVKANI